MPRLEYPLLLALASLSFVAQGQELPPIVQAAPPVVAMDVQPEGHLAGNSYPNFRCDDWDCCHQWWCATWYTRVELLALARDHDPQNRTIVQAGGTSVFNTNDIDFELTPGVSTLLGHRIDGVTAFELSYYGANEWNEGRLVAGAGNLVLPGSLVLLDAFNGANAIRISLRSEMHNAEVNVLRDVQNVSLLAGFRYFSWQEQLGIHVFDRFDVAFEENDYNIELSNNLVGGQIGARAARHFYGLDIDFTGKAGIFGNEATVNQRVTVLNGTTLQRDFTVTEGVVAFLGDLNLSVNCPLTPVWRLRGGYNMVFVSNLALAANQLDFAIDAPRRQRVRQDSDVFLHGFNVGLEAIW